MAGWWAAAGSKFGCAAESSSGVASAAEVGRLEVFGRGPTQRRRRVARRRPSIGSVAFGRAARRVSITRVRADDAARSKAWVETESKTARMDWMAGSDMNAAASISEIFAVIENARRLNPASSRWRRHWRCSAVRAFNSGVRASILLVYRVCLVVSRVFVWFLEGILRWRFWVGFGGGERGFLRKAGGKRVERLDIRGRDHLLD